VLKFSLSVNPSSPPFTFPCVVFFSCKCCDVSGVKMLLCFVLLSISRDLFGAYIAWNFLVLCRGGEESHSNGMHILVVHKYAVCWSMIDVPSSNSSV